MAFPPGTPFQTPSPILEARVAAVASPWAVAAPPGPLPGQVQPPRQGLASRVRRAPLKSCLCPCPHCFCIPVSRGTLIQTAAW